MEKLPSGDFNNEPAIEDPNNNSSVGTIEMTHSYVNKVSQIR